VDDLVDGIWRLLGCDYVGPVNIGSQAEVSMLHLAQQIVRITGSRSEIAFRPLPPDDPKVRRPDTTLAERILGWRPVVPVDEGLLRTRDYFVRALADEAKAGP
jgi:dTDP-glucose 4,6-dehydratase